VQLCPEIIYDILGRVANPRLVATLKTGRIVQPVTRILTRTVFIVVTGLGFATRPNCARIYLK